MTIVHGLSEYCICTSVKSNLKIKQEIISRKNGRQSIQINSLHTLLNDNRFKSFNTFTRNFPDIENKKSKLVGFRLFIIMDVDDCDEETKERYKNKEMFRGHWIFDYINPIFNEPNLEKTMDETGIKIDRKKDYIKVFPTNHNGTNIEMAEEFAGTLRKCKSTNMEEYIDYCLVIARENSI